MEELKFDVPVVVLQGKTLKSILEKNPYSKEARKDPSKVLIGFYASNPDTKPLRALNEKPYPPNQFEAKQNALYLFCPNGVGRAKLPNFENVLGARITFRNARVSQDLLELCGNN